MTKRSSTLILALIGIVVLAVGFVAFKSSGPVVPANCAPTTIAIDKGNSVHGLKNSKLFAYIDLAGMAPALACHSDADILSMLNDAVTAQVADWWKEPRLASATQGEVHIITILDKDEYARASFNAALVHGKMEFTRKGDHIEALPATLTFDNMRTALTKKH